ncbi:MAG: hypothetical protein IPM24_24060 [Bryobacterales bacterium]|nr:hypothetical protein [Bryobacterales bacterium]
MHFTNAQWLDFARGLASPELATEMQHHLAKGCLRCAALARAMVVVEQTMARDRAMRVPQEAVRRAANLFPQSPQVSWSDLPRRAAALLFDSDLEPVTAGVRSAGPRIRHVVFDAGPFRVDLRMEHEQPQPVLALTGQVASPSAPVAGLRVAVSDGSRTLAESLCNEFGEFQMECRPRDGLQVLLWSQSDGAALVMEI